MALACLVGPVALALGLLGGLFLRGRGRGARRGS